MKKILKKIIPQKVVKYLRWRQADFLLIGAYYYDYKRYKKFSATKNLNSRVKFLGQIIKEYHIIEKGLTMPEPRLGFGRDRIFLLCDHCESYISLYGLDNNQIIQTIALLLEYEEFHNSAGYHLDSLVLAKIEVIQNIAKKYNISPSSQLLMTKEEYFKEIDSSFEEFSNTRKSVRNYSSDKIPSEIIHSALKLTLNTPSVCNRQGYRAYVYSNKERIKEIFSTQNGNRGFGNLADKIIVVTVELGILSHSLERNQAFIDGGLYLMNLLYALHSKGIVACTLNCSNTPKYDKMMRKACEIKDSEIFIGIISCGYPKDEFSIALSKRLDIDEIVTFID